MTYSAYFGKEIEMDISIHGGESPYAEAVLLQQGYELCSSDIRRNFFGLWAIEYEGMIYTAEVKEE